MPRRKKLPAVPDIEGPGNHPDVLLVQKTNPLMSLSKTDMTLSEFKILDTYLGRINSHDPDKRYIRLEKGEIEKLLGVTKINAPDLEKRLKNLFQTVIIRDINKRKGFTLISLFEKAECNKDEDGLWFVDLGASAAAIEYIFTPENIGYLRYRLSNVVNLTSRYSYVLFLYLEQNRHMHLTWEIPLDELKELLRCTADSYKGFKEFNDKILKKCQTELNKKTTCHFTYEPMKRGRVVKSVQFTLEPLPEPDGIPGQMSFTDFPGPTPVISPDILTPERARHDDICFGFSSSEFDDFTDEQLRFLKDLAWPKKREEDVISHNDVLHDYTTACQQATADYLRRAILIAKSRGAKKIFLYVKAMIENDRKGADE